MKRPSFTLLELLLVLALISMISGLGIAGYQRRHERAKFTSGVVGIQIDLNRTRLLAMRSGQAYLFRFIPGTGIYEIAPLETLQEAIYRMNEDATDNLMDPLGGSLSSGVYDSSSLYSSSGYGANNNGASGSYGADGELLSDNLFSPENIRADMEEAGLLKPSAGALANATGLGGSLSGGYGVADSSTYDATAPSGSTTLGGSTASSSLNPFASISADGMGTGGQFALGTDTTLINLSDQGITLREMNSEERPLGATENTLAWRVNRAGLVVRKEATGGVVFTFSRLSDSTPTNLKKRRPGGAQNSQNAQGAFSDMVGEDLGSRLGGSLLSVPTSGDSEGLGGGLTARTSGVDLYENAVTNYEEETEARSLWSEPVLFYPNGRASTVVFGLASLGKYSYYSEIGVRGMTGYARISSITSLSADARPDASVLTQEQYFRMSHPGTTYGTDRQETGLVGGALGGTGTDATTADAFGSSSVYDTTGGALGTSQDSEFGTTGLSSLDTSINQSFTPNYGSTDRRSGYRFDANATPGARNDAVGGVTGAALGGGTNETTAGNGLAGGINAANASGIGTTDPSAFGSAETTPGLGAAPSAGTTPALDASGSAGGVFGGGVTDAPNVETANPARDGRGRDRNASGGGL